MTEDNIMVGVQLIESVPYTGVYDSSAVWAFSPLVERK